MDAVAILEVELIAYGLRSGVVGSIDYRFFIEITIQAADQYEEA